MRAYVEVRSVDDYQSIRQRARGHRWHRSFMDICGLSPSSSWMMHYLYVAARIAYIVITGVTHYRWGIHASTTRYVSVGRLCRERSIFIFEFPTTIAPYLSILRRELRRLVDRINLIRPQSIGRSSFPSIFNEYSFLFFFFF